MTAGKWMPAEPTDDMLNAAQERLCELRNFTHFEDDVEAEKYKAMYAVAPASPGPWMDIASAPKDGTKLLLKVAPVNGEEFFITGWFENDEWLDAYHGPLVDVVGWMPQPLPAPPGSEAPVTDEMAGHVPTPWEYEQDMRGDGAPLSSASVYVVEKDGDEPRHIAQFTSKHDAALACNAVNRAASPVTADVRKVLEPFVAEFIRSTNPGDSDLDNEQPYHLVVPLGACRAARALLARWG